MGMLFEGRWIDEDRRSGLEQGGDAPLYIPQI